MSTGKLVAITLSVCCGIGALFIACCGGLFYLGYTGFKNADAVASPKIDAMCAAIANDDLENSYANEMTTEFKKAVSKEQFLSVGKIVAQRLGSLKSKSVGGFKLRQRNSDSYIDVTYPAVFEKGKGTIVSTLKKQGDEWKFDGFRVDSPVFEQDIGTKKCPSCNQPHASTAKFCPSCGASLSNQLEN